MRTQHAHKMDAREATVIRGTPHFGWRWRAALWCVAGARSGFINGLCGGYGHQPVTNGVGRCDSNQQIADKLVLSVRTLERHLGHVYDKLGVTGKSARAVATAYAIGHGLVPVAAA